MGPKGRRQGERPAAARFEVVRHGLTAHLGSPTNFRTYPYWPHIPGIFTPQSHLGCVVARNRLFSSSGGASRVGSIPIARSTSRIGRDA